MGRKALEAPADGEFDRTWTVAELVEPTGALGAHPAAKRAAAPVRRAGKDGRLSQAAFAASASPFAPRVLLAAAIALPLALLAAAGLGGTLLGWAAPSATARAVEAARGLLGAFGLPGETPWLPAARDMAAYWAARGAAGRGVVFAAAADAGALLSVALVPLMVLPCWAVAARRRFEPSLPSDAGVLRRGRLFGAFLASVLMVLVWGCAHLLVHGAVDPGRAVRPGDFRASPVAPAWWALMALCGPLFAAGLPSLVVAHVIRRPAR